MICIVVIAESTTADRLWLTTASTIIISNYFIEIFRGIFPRFFLVYYTIVHTLFYTAYTPSIVYADTVYYRWTIHIILYSNCSVCAYGTLVPSVHTPPVPPPPYMLYMFYNLNCLQLCILPSMLWKWQGAGRGRGIQKIFFVFVNNLQKTKSVAQPWAGVHLGFSTLSWWSGGRGDAFILYHFTLWKFLLKI